MSCCKTLGMGVSLYPSNYPISIGDREPESNYFVVYIIVLLSRIQLYLYALYYTSKD